MNRRDFLRGIAATMGVGALVSGAQAAVPEEWNHFGVTKTESDLLIFKDGRMVCSGLGAQAIFDANGLTIGQAESDCCTVRFTDRFKIDREGRITITATNVTANLLTG